MRYFSMFTGIGGFELGIQNAAQRLRRFQRRDPDIRDLSDSTHTGRRGSSPTCVGYSEIDGYAIKTYEEHFGHENYGDATTINAGRLPDFDLLVGGFPCQAFSIAGQRGGFDDTRGTLFFDVARILKEKRPRHLVLENVKGLLSHDYGKTFQTILGVLADLGYRVEWQVLNSRHFGVPQNRERVYIVGHLRGGCRSAILPIGATDNGHPETNRGVPRVYALTEARTAEAKAIRSEGFKSGIDFSPRRGKTLQPRTDRVGNTLTGGLTREHLLTDGVRIRKLMPIECERLQGFPDHWTLGSDTQRYKQCGNAVTVNVVEAVMIKLMEECL